MTTFECAVAVWTGARETPLERVLSASKLDTIAGRLRVSLSPARGVLLSRAASNSSSLRTTPRVLLATERLRSFAVYSVLLLVDVGECQQQCYFLGRVQRFDAEQTASDAGDARSEAWALYGDLEAPTALLGELHKRFPEVPLVPSARELLSLITKRRRTLSASHFYGQQAPARPLAAKSSAPLTAQADADSSAWKAFYEKLQFRVSRSQMCQLQGTAEVASVFPRQQEAFEFADQIAAFRRRLQAHATDTGNSDTARDVASQWPRVFSFEDAREGKRRFLVSSFASFWDTYAHRTLATQRHVYEIIRERVPCRLYFDLEFKKSCNPRVDGDQLVARLVSLVQLQLFQRKFHVHARREQIVQLDSSDAAKFSRHLIFHLPEGALFADNIHAGNFVRGFIHDLVESAREAEDEDSPFLVNTGREQQQQSVATNTLEIGPATPQRQLFIDTGVYTRNRMFRVLGSSKFRRDAVLRPLPLASSASSSASPVTTTPPDDTSSVLRRGTFLDALVCPFPTLEALQASPHGARVRLLHCEQDESALQRSSGARPLWAPAGRASNRLSRARAVERRASGFPKIDAFVLATARRRGGVEGEIRAVQVLFDSVDVALPGDPTPEHSSGGAAAPKTPWMLVYQMARNRWCWNVQRAHKSNNVMYVVDLEQRVCYQKCHDQVCNTVDYRSPPLPLPPDLLNA
ncbi:hypothetical protein PybrP1_002634 [[Pythium] brassicae (nom. inval.)]|nr:hypothetical protein PybrP1_002634 [[Pythium] brassicae (nom. inval.)]